MIQHTDTEKSQDTPWCQGEEGASPHPKVYLAYDGDGMAVCPYCGHRFEKRG